jgi:hypothetical protein
MKPTVGILDTKVSMGSDLLSEQEVAGHGAPTHKPQTPRQNYTDVDSGRVWNWLNGDWH